jgi:hypothetical protein
MEFELGVRASTWRAPSFCPKHHDGHRRLRHWLTTRISTPSHGILYLQRVNERHSDSIHNALFLDAPGVEQDA